MCRDAAETIDHILLKCPEACQVWYGSVLRVDRIDQDILNGGAFHDSLWTAMHYYPVEYISLMVYNAWELWKS